MSEQFEKFLSKLEQTTGQRAEFDGREWHSCCPAHPDGRRSLAIHLTIDGRVLMRCTYGCAMERIAQAVGVPLDSLLTRPSKPPLPPASPAPPARATPLYSDPSPSGIRMLLSKEEPVVTRLDQCERAIVRWLWPGRIPLGKLTMLVGDPGLGKSLVALDIAARVSRGLAMPRLDSQVAAFESASAEPAAPGSVVLLSAEDEAADTIRPRLETLGADLSRIVVLDAIDQVSFGGSQTRRVMFSLESHLVALETVLRSQADCRLVVIDPITAYLGRTSVQNHARIRRMLAAMGGLAARHGVAVLAVNHLTKKGYGPAIYRSIGSLAFAATARSVLGVFADMEEAHGRVLVPLKSNLSAHAAGIGYEVVRGDGGSGEVATPAIRWGTREIPWTPEELLRAASRERGAGPAVQEAVSWLSTALGEGPQSAMELKRRARADGIHERTLLRAKARLGVATSRDGFGAGGNWVWRMASGVVE